MGLKLRKLKRERKREYVWECEMKKREKEGKWEVSLHQYDLLLHSEYSGKTPYSRIKIPHWSKQNIHFYLLKSYTHFFPPPLDRSTERHCVTWRGTWTLNPDKSSDIALWLCFQMDHVTHQKREEREERGWWGRVTEERRIIRCGDGKTRKVYSQSSEFGVGLEEKLWEKLEFVSVQTTASRKWERRRKENTVLVEVK